MDVTGFKTLYWRQFNSIREGAEYFHVSKVTVRRWLNGETIINPMAEKLLIIKSLGYLPNNIRWEGFRMMNFELCLSLPKVGNSALRNWTLSPSGVMNIVNWFAYTAVSSDRRISPQKRTSYRSVAGVVCKQPGYPRNSNNKKPAGCGLSKTLHRYFFLALTIRPPLA